MDFKKFLEMVSEQELLEAKKESTAKKDHKAEKAGKKVAKDIEYDEGHKGKDDHKAEKAGKKVTKDIEYDDKRDKAKKKKSLRDWFEEFDKEMLAEAEQITIAPAKQNTQVIKQGNKTLGSVSNPQLAQQIKQSIGRGEMSLAGAEIKEEGLDEKWAGDAKVKPTGQYKDKTKEELKSMLAKLHKSGPHGKDSPAAKKMRQINFALRAKGGWKSGEGAAMKEEAEQIDEISLDLIRRATQQAGYKAADHEAAAQDRADAGARAGDPEEKAHTQAAKAYRAQQDRLTNAIIARKEKQFAKPLVSKAKLAKKTEEAEIPHSGPDYGAGLGAGRKGNMLEAKPDFLDLDKDGNKRESMKKAAKDAKKKKVDESMDKAKVAYHEGKACGMERPHHYNCRYDHGSPEHEAFHRGFKEGLDECYGLMPVQGLVVGETMPAATVPGMASQAMPAMEADMEEGNAFTAALAKTPKGEKFSVGGKTFTDTSNYNAKVDEYAFESLDKQLEDLLNEETVVTEGLSVNMQQGLGDGGDDSVSVTATGEDSGKLLDFIKQVGLGGISTPAAAEVVSVAEPAVAVASDYGAPKFAGHDDMKSLISKVTGGEEEKKSDQKPEAKEAKTCETHGMSEGECGCGNKDKAVDETETPDQMTDQMAEDSAGADEEAETRDDENAEAAEDSALAKAAQQNKTDTVNEGGDGMEDEEAVEESKEEKLDEWANQAGGDVKDATFERDIDFMTKVIAGGLNKPKATGQTTTPVIAGQEAREGDEDVRLWKRLAGLEK